MQFYREILQILSPPVLYSALITKQAVTVLHCIKVRIDLKCMYRQVTLANTLLVMTV